MKRSGVNSSTSTPGAPVVIQSVMSRAVIGASKMPLRKWAVATHKPSTSGHGPRMGRLSGAHGRKPYHVRAIGSAPSEGTSPMAAASRLAIPSAVTERWKPTRSTVAPISSSPDARGTR